METYQANFPKNNCKKKKAEDYPDPVDLGDPPPAMAEWAEKVIASWNLCPSEMKCLQLLLKGMTDKEIASTLGNSEKTIKHHLHTIRLKSRCSSRCEIFAEILRL